MKKSPLLLLAASLYSSLAISQSAVNAFVNAPDMKRANLSVMIKDVETGETILQHRADKNTVPASTTKLVTTATALEILGPDFTFTTKLQYDGTIENGVLNGNIYILGGGDPTLGSKYMGDSLFLDKWTAAVKQLGIKKITGTVIGDGTLYDTQGIPPRWTWEDMGNYYAAGAYGISIYDDTYKVYFNSGEAGTTPEIIRVEPLMPDLRFKLFLKSANINDDSAYFYGAPYSNDRSIYGEIPANRKEFVSKGDIPYPALYAAQVFRQNLVANGVEVTQPATADVITGNTRTTFFTQTSPTLKEIIGNINYKSNNHYAEHLFNYLALQKAKQANITDAVSVIKNFWKSKGLDISGFIINDGCGLSPSNAISAKFFVDLLTFEANKSSYKNVFISTLPVAGESGTVRKLLKGTRLEGKVHAKSGSIFDVQCFAGYIDWKNKQYAFAVLVNNYTGSRKSVIEEIEKLLLSVAK
ncbi:MAG: D-alanyl-D-alanine carboxypeptidase/D-alanyl-D-alanine-endopeptidase [Paludibacteraceae bacterium]|nr:D-alanyl-D-alanine carboxypeptidase/D-alanyl-D-alanine-endopeptidase [Paludibacteraceae bacterium]